MVMTVGGSDSVGGAGIQADIKTFHSLGVHGTCAVTSVTSQNTREVRARFDLPPEVVVSQMEAVLMDIEVAAVKTGMLAGADTVRAVAEVLERYGVRCLVVDPVAASSSGQPLLDEGGLDAVVERLLPLATVFTPNLEEAGAVLGQVVRGVEGMRRAARALKAYGPRCVVVKGGHLGGGEATDIFYDGTDMAELRAPRLHAPDSHGTGCVFSAAVAARLALGAGPRRAAEGAKADVLRSLENALRLGGGSGPVRPVTPPGS